MSYLRVIPRDLFNESKLLKCLARLYIESEHQPEGAIAFRHDGGAFQIEQDGSDGSIFVANVRVIVNGCRVDVYTTLNARGELPMYFTFNDDIDRVFDDEGRLTKEFLGIGA